MGGDNNQVELVLGGVFGQAVGGLSLEQVRPDAGAFQLDPAGYLAQAGTGANVMFLLVIGWIAALSPTRTSGPISPVTTEARRQ